MPKSRQITGTRNSGGERCKSGTRMTRRDVLAGAAAWAVLPPLTLSTRAAAADFFKVAALVGTEELRRVRVEDCEAGVAVGRKVRTNVHDSIIDRGDLQKV